MQSLSRKIRYKLLLFPFFAFADIANSFVANQRDFCKNRMITTTASAPTAGSSTSSYSPTSVLVLGAKENPLEPHSEIEKDSCQIEPMGEAAVPTDPRSCILEVGACAGKLCCVANQLGPESLETLELNSETKALLTKALAELFASLWLTAKALRLDWVKSIRSKMALNAKKYPVEHCKVRGILHIGTNGHSLPIDKWLSNSCMLVVEYWIAWYDFVILLAQGKAGKYTNYSHLTGITTANQSTMDYVDNDMSDGDSNIKIVDLSLAGFAEKHLVVLANDIRVFAEERQWARYHKPRNLVMALLGETGELAEILQFESDDWEQIENEEERLLLVDKLHSCEPERLDELSQELADVSIYALRLATVCDVLDDLHELLIQQDPPQDLEAKQLFA